MVLTKILEPVMNRYLSDIKTEKIIAIYELNNLIEFVYSKDDVEKSMVIRKACHFGPMYDGCWFEFSNIALDSQRSIILKQPSIILQDIESIEDMNFYSKELENGAYLDLEILYTAKDGTTGSYLFHPQPHEEDVHEIGLLKNQKSSFKLLKRDSQTMPKELYSTQIYKDALAFALKAHGEQKTPQGLPYSFHIVSVANEIINSLSMHRISYDEANIAIMCALLHDVNEDTTMKATRQYVELPHIETIEDGVVALTKDTTLPSKQEQMKDSLERLKEMPKCVQMVKLADRITNLAPAPEFWSKNKRKSYVDEAKFILRELEESNPYLAQKLKNKIENYLVEKAVDSRGFTTVDNYLVFYGNDKALVLDKNHKLYLKTFKAMNRLSEYVKQAYEITLFEKYTNKETLQREKNIVGLEYISTTINTKNLLDINKHIDEKIAKYMSIIYEGEAVLCKNFSK